MTMVYGVGSGFLIGISGEHDAHGVGRELFCLGQKLHAIHAGHLHFRHHDGVGTLFGHGGQSGFAAECGIDGKLFAKISLITREDVGVIINEKDFSAHVGFNFVT